MHRLPAQCKVAALVCCVLVVVATPRGWFPAFGGYAAVLAAVATVARVPAGVVLRRARVELPFVLFALALPFLATGPRVSVAGLEMSRTGLLGAWGILAKGTLGVVGSVLLGATTRPADIVAGLHRLRLPVALVQVAGFMLRYAEVVTGELRRMRIAQRSRGFDRRAPHRLRVAARTAGALFVRSFERGERVYLAMCSRGYRIAGQCTARQGGGEGPRGRAARPEHGGSLCPCGAKGKTGSPGAPGRTQPGSRRGARGDMKRLRSGRETGGGNPGAVCGEPGTRPGAARSARSTEGIPGLQAGGGCQTGTSPLPTGTDATARQWAAAALLPAAAVLVLAGAWFSTGSGTGPPWLAAGVLSAGIPGATR